MPNIQNHPDLWRDSLPVKKADGYKYIYGAAIILGAPSMTGASRLAAQSCARMGAGLVTVLSVPESFDIYRTALGPHIICRNTLDYQDEHEKCRLYGPGGVPGSIDFNIQTPVVLDADALHKMPAALTDNFILTPHEGEFAAIFPDINNVNKVDRAKAAARKSGAHIVLKGSKTVIAAPDGRAPVLNEHASPWLATGGTGDVLAGMITGLIAAGMPVFEGICAAVWIHGECGRRIGPGLVAEDIEKYIPRVLKDLIFNKI